MEVADTCARQGVGHGEVMRYWDEDHPEWDAPERDFAEAWRRQPKWVVDAMRLTYVPA